MRRTATAPPPAVPAVRPSRDLEHLAWLMDRAIKIPGTNITVGLDALLGLLPVGGDVLTGLVQAGLVLVALTRYKVPRPVAARMVANVLLDIGLGSIPLVGDVFDIFFKANTRNLQLLSEVQAHRDRSEPVPTGPSVRYLIGIGIVFFLALAAATALFIVLLLWLAKALFSHPLI